MELMVSLSLLTLMTTSTHASPQHLSFANHRFRGLWPNPHNSDNYIEEGGHVIKAPDSG